ncbi:hypothetical protein [Mesorhizobium sp. WSM2239]|uniref:Uncharacterized protein n=2 Tax=unclassified Mesorhizobium TaxID=325217 RepID=A0AAU8D8E2_9HYPH
MRQTDGIKPAPIGMEANRGPSGNSLILLQIITFADEMQGGDEPLMVKTTKRLVGSSGNN